MGIYITFTVSVKVNDDDHLRAVKKKLESKIDDIINSDKIFDYCSLNEAD